MSAEYITLDCRDGIHAGCETCSCYCHRVRAITGGISVARILRNIRQKRRAQIRRRVLKALQPWLQGLAYGAVAFGCILIIRWMLILLWAAFG
jgi:hypothetical protein